MCWLCEDLSSGSAAGARQPSQVMLSRSEGGNACYLVLSRVSEQDSAHHQRSPALFFVCASIRWPVKCERDF